MYGLIGAVLGHSYSKMIHESFGLESYSMFELDETQFEEKIKKRDYKGLNITVPYKQKVMSFLDVIDDDAAAIGAVNTVVNKDGTLYGYNTDYYGFEYLLCANRIDVSGKKVLVLGNGGVAKPIFHYLAKHGASEVIVVKRTSSVGIVSYEEAYDKHRDAKIIINATPVGMFPNVEESPMKLDGYDNLEAVVDVIANPKVTKIMQYAIDKGVKAVGGIEMLVAQAKLAEEHFRDVSICDDRIGEVAQELNKLMIG